jgi:ABC-2 type transport system permease protein
VVLVGVTFGVVTYVAALIGTEESFSAATFFLLSATVLLVQIFFLALGMLFAVLIPKIKSVVTVSLPAVFAFFIIGTLGEIVGNEEVRYITPFKFFDPLYIMNNQSLETKFLLLEVAAVAVLVAVAYTTFQKKNLRASA